MPDNRQRKSGKKTGAGRRCRPLALSIILRFFQTIGTLILVAILTGSLVCCYAAIYIKTVAIPLAEQTDMSTYTMDENTIIYYYDEDGNPVELATLSGDENRQRVTYDQLPQDLIDAFVAIEDERFWQHKGVDWYRTAGAVVNMFLSMRNTFGGSTITQQLVKNVTEYDDGTVRRKVVEIFSALEVERDYEKEDIITWYLNEIFLGNGCYGVQAAAKYYFGKDVADLTLAECASLAGITNNPSLYSPNAPLSVTRYLCADCEKSYSLSTEEACSYCGGENYHEGEIWTGREYNKARQETILYKMQEADISPDGPYITQAEYAAALDEELVFVWDRDEDEVAAEAEAAAAAESKTTADIHPWYVDAVIAEVINDLVEKYDYSKRAATQMVYSGGLRIYVPYDPDIQAKVDQIYNDRSNLDYVSKTGQQLSSAITVIDNATGYVVAIAGDVGEKTLNRGWNNALTLRQPGSSIKPLAVYAPALEMGLITPASISDDNPRLLNENPWPVNAPLGWRGLTTIQDAVVRSVNTIAVNVLEMVTPMVSYEYMTQRFGITSLTTGTLINGAIHSDTADYGALAMGGLTNGLSTFEMAAAYATFPRNGAFTEATTYLLVKDFNGDTLINNKPKTEFVIKESTAYYINAMLTEAVNSGTGYRAKIDGQIVAGKTGTTNSVYDLWFAGYTPYYTAAVWTGYPNNEYMNISGNPSVTMWQKVMALIHEDLDRAEFHTPDELREYTICLDCGKLATTDCGNDLRGNRAKTVTLLKEDRPLDYCTCHIPVTVCTQCPILTADGEETGAYHLAGEHCPAEFQKTVTMVEYERVLATEEVEVRDYYALMSIYNTLEDPYCTVHLPPDPGPSDDPVDPGVPEGPGEGTDPWNPEPEPTDDPEPEPTSTIPVIDDPFGGRFPGRY